MIEAVWDNAFKRSYRKRIHRVPHLKNQFREKMELFLEEPFDPHLRTHAPPPRFPKKQPSARCAQGKCVISYPLKVTRKKENTDNR